MRTLEVFPREIDVKKWRYGSVGDECKVLVNEPTRLMHQGKLIASYMQLDQASLEPVRQAVLGLKFSKGARTLGIKQNSLTFGYMPRHAIRNNVCRPTKMATQYSVENELICGLAPTLESYYRDQAPITYKNHSKAVLEKVLPAWRLRGSIFTSGIINQNSAMNFHTDTGNFPGCWSAMVVFKNKVTGGHLYLPELDLRIECADCSLLIFNGQEYMHGVTPISMGAADSYRYSIVYYSLQQLWHCLEPKEEFRRLLKYRTESERNKTERTKDILSKSKGKK